MLDTSLDLLTALPAQPTAAAIYWIFIIAIIMVLLHFLDRVYRISKNWFVWIIFCPPLSLIFILRNWDEVKSACFLFCGLYIIILFAGALTGYGMARYTTAILQLIFLWPLVLGQWLIATNFLQDLFNH
jgi:hypothetical protein